MKKIVCTTNGSASIGPYSQAVIGNNIVFISGQLPVDRTTGAVVENEIKAQTYKCLENVKAVLEASGSSMDLVLKTTVFLSNMDDFAAMNEVYQEFFNEGNYPARSTIQVSRLPKDVLIEIEASALCY
ncbi:MAG: RidA family protein [Clostridiaceae bacterium]|nr:RidA family protein [Clostridiaceae bacterium]